MCCNNNTKDTEDEEMDETFVNTIYEFSKNTQFSKLENTIS